jgi:hypothetical protein
MLARRLLQHPHSSTTPFFCSALAPIFYHGPNKTAASRADLKKRDHHRLAGFHSFPKCGQKCTYRSLLV